MGVFFLLVLLVSTAVGLVGFLDGAVYGDGIGTHALVFGQHPYALIQADLLAGQALYLLLQLHHVLLQKLHMFLQHFHFIDRGFWWGVFRG